MKPLLLALSVAVIVLVIAVMQPRPDGYAISPPGRYGPPDFGCNPPPGGNWIIDSTVSGGTCTCSGENIGLNADANIIVDDATLDLGTCHVVFNCISPGSCGVIVRNGGGLIMGVFSRIEPQPGPNPNAFTFNVSGASLGGVASSLTMTGAYVTGAGMDAEYSKSGIYVKGATVTIGGGSQITGGYRGLVLDSIIGGDISDSIFNWNSGDGIYLYNVTNTVISDNFVMNSEGNGIVVNGTGAVSTSPLSGNGISISGNDVYNNSYGILLVDSNMTDGNVTGNYIHKNRNDGIRDINPYGEFYVTFNSIYNNSGYAVYTNVIIGPKILAEVQNNTMCYNDRSVYWEGWNLGISESFYYVAGMAVYAPANNQFCVNISVPTPIRWGCTDSDEINFYVDGNPWAEAIPHADLPNNGFTNCSMYIDGIYKNSTRIVGMNNHTSLTFDGTMLNRGSHTYNVTCDPPLTDIVPNAGGESGSWDITDPVYDTGSSGGSGPPGSGGPDCVPNITLGINWTDGTCSITHVVLSTNETKSIVADSGGYRNYTNGNYSSPKTITGNVLWTNFSWWNASVENDIIGWLAWANDTAGRWSQTANTTFNATPCLTESVVQGVGGGTTTGSCGNITLGVLWNSGTANISWSWLSTNETGAWTNYTGLYGSPLLINASSGWSNFSWWNQSVKGQSVFWRGCANNTWGNENCTATSSFTAVPCANAAPITSGVCDLLNLRIDWNGTALNQSHVMLSTNETGAWRNYTDAYGSPKSIPENASSSSFGWWNASVGGRAIGWTVCWNSSLGDWKCGNASSFTAVPCANATVITAGTCGPLTFRVTWEGTAMNQSMAVLSTNETGAWKNYTDGTYGSPMNITEGAAQTDFSWWNASVDGMVVSWKVYWNSSLGDWMGSTNSTFTAQPCATPPPVTGPGGGGGGGSGTSSCYAEIEGGANFIFQSATAGGTAECVGGKPMRSVGVKFGTATESKTYVYVREITAPAGVVAPSKEIYGWFNISTTIPSVAATNLTWAVQNDWLDSRNLSRAWMYRWDARSHVWQPVPTVVLNRTDNDTLHLSALTGFSVFAIAGPQACSCPAAVRSTCSNDLLNLTVWDCGSATNYACVKNTTEVPCCDACQSESVTDCLNGKLSREMWKCSAATNYECAKDTAVEGCGNPFQQIALPNFTLPGVNKGQSDLLIVLLLAVPVALVALFLFWRRRKKKLELPPPPPPEVSEPTEPKKRVKVRVKVAIKKAKPVKKHKAVKVVKPQVKPDIEPPVQTVTPEKKPQSSKRQPKKIESTKPQPKKISPKKQQLKESQPKKQQSEEPQPKKPRPKKAPLKKQQLKKAPLPPAKLKSPES